MRMLLKKRKLWSQQTKLVSRSSSRRTMTPRQMLVAEDDDGIMAQMMEDPC
jgi:hypothetical protein